MLEFETTELEMFGQKEGQLVLSVIDHVDPRAKKPDGSAGGIKLTWLQRAAKVVGDGLANAAWCLPS